MDGAWFGTIWRGVRRLGAPVACAAMPTAVVVQVVLTSRLLERLAAHPLGPLSPRAKAIHDEYLYTQKWLDAYGVSGSPSQLFTTSANRPQPRIAYGKQR